MDCACVYVGGYDGPNLYWVKMRIARKPNTCIECERTIEPGEKYEHDQSRYEDWWSSHVTCLDCKSIRDSFFCDGWLFGSMLDNLHEHIENMNGEIASECIVPLTPRAREMVCEMIEKAWEIFEDEEEWE